MKVTIAFVCLGLSAAANAELQAPADTAAMQAPLTATAARPPTASDPRQLADSRAPGWLQAVGRLTVPGVEWKNGERRQRQENCSATLVSRDTILTAWHCLEHYRDLSQDILFTLSGAPVRRVHILSSGGGMQADWALLRMHTPLSGIEPAAVNTHGIISDAAPLSVAGYSRDEGLGADGENLTWQAQCQSTENQHYRVATNCLAFKGASGGPVVQAARVVGVISAGDSARLTYYAPTRSFSSALRLHLH